jgi:hypothetical protein
MGDALIGVGILLAIVGPLLLIPFIWIVYRLVTRKIIYRFNKDKYSHSTNDLIAISVSTAMILVLLVLSYLPGKMEFDKLCSQHGTPSIQKRVHTNNFYRTRLYPYEAKQFLGEEGFEFIEAPHMYNKGSYMKYSLAEDGMIKEEEISETTSRYGIRDDLKLLTLGINLSQKTAYEMESGKEFAQAATILYSGGPLSIFMGVYAMSNCPDIISEQGSKDFNTYYNFEKEILLDKKN